ncbi:Protein of unknown function [Propionibacterium freudenreichii]|nr:Putative uncharacterized protein [Propionibacterium freudenreichii subsp. freudenreichii]CEG87249.1 Protein of unknown function [Propionibacterium freudenreichii]CEG88043.1 Protein of unknown function [Propionibacterium freudenreichii]CEH02180.1 Protein of unknown function [Propionibacterium freudenreichii]CEH08545.1 Protein of unknown function [Propionibacterium freudenreichii]
MISRFRRRYLLGFPSLVYIAEDVATTDS